MRKERCSLIEIAFFFCPKLQYQYSSTRKGFQRGIQLDLPSSPMINLLLVTARPDDESDVGYRTVSRPLTEAI
ncbi:MAG: hypothetical protein VKJ64_11495 [Leptolyngbyaceae bacterium]|nr:hypothetical protein [Leptolyngbyaceae bacterium]